LYGYLPLCSNDTCYFRLVPLRRGISAGLHIPPNFRPDHQTSLGQRRLHQSTGEARRRYHVHSIPKLSTRGSHKPANIIKSPTCTLQISWQVFKYCFRRIKLTMDVHRCTRSYLQADLMAGYYDQLDDDVSTSRECAVLLLCDPTSVRGVPRTVVVVTLAPGFVAAPPQLESQSGPCGTPRHG